jgi:hypothetical protein
MFDTQGEQGEGRSILFNTLVREGVDTAMAPMRRLKVTPL